MRLQPLRRRTQRSTSNHFSSSSCVKGKGGEESLCPLVRPLSSPTTAHMRAFPPWFLCLKPIPCPGGLIGLFPLRGSVPFRESPEYESCDEHGNQHQEGNQRTNNAEKRIVDEEDAVFQSVYDPRRWSERDGSLRIIDHQHIAIALIIIASPIAGIHNGRSKGCVRFLFDETSFFQVSADGISFQVHGRSNVMGGKMGGSTQLNPTIIGGLPSPDELSPYQRSCLPESNMSPVCDILVELFKSEILDAPKDVEITDWCRGVASMSETRNSNFLACLGSNGIWNQPPCLVKAARNLLLTSNKDEIERDSLCSGFCMGDPWIGGEIRGVRGKSKKSNEDC